MGEKGNPMDILKESLTFSQNNIREISFNKKSIKSVLAIGIFSSMIELTRSMITLLETNNFTGPYSIFRTFLECYVDVINIHNNEEYFKLLMLEFHEREERLMRSSKKGNKYTKSLLEMDNFCLIYKKHKNEIRSLKKIVQRVDGKTTIAEKFTMAGLKDEYDSIYSKLCTEAHSSLEAVLNRHLEFDEDNKDMTVLLYNNKKAADFYYYIGTMPLLLLKAGVLTCETLNSGSSSLFSEKYHEVELMIINN